MGVWRRSHGGASLLTVPGAQVLQVSDETPGAWAGLEVSDDVFERRTPEGRVVGFAVFNVSRHDRDKLALPLTVTAV